MDTNDTLTLGQFLGVLRRRRWIILQLVAIAAVAALALALRSSQDYQADAAVLVGAPQQVQFGGSPDTAPSLAPSTAAKLIRTNGIAERVRALLQTQLSVRELLDRVTTTPDTADGIVTVTGHGGSGAEAARIANAFASQFVSARADARLATFTKAIQTVERALTRVPPTGAQHDALSQQLTQLQTVGALSAADAQFVDNATAPDKPAAPHLARDVLIGLGIGLLLGLLTAFGLEALDPRVKASEELQRLVPAPQLASVPATIFKRGGFRERSRPRVLTTGRTHFEAFERLRTSLLVFNGERALKTVLVTSPRDEREGKTTVAANLALSLAKVGLKVCVVDADLRRPRLARHFGYAESERGLTDLIKGAPLNTVVRKFPVPDAPVLKGNGNGNGKVPHVSEISVVCAGQKTDNPAEMLAGKGMGDVLDQLEAQHDIVILDVAPLLQASDAMPLLPRAETLLVVRLFHTPRKAAARAARVIERSNGALLGVVGTGVPARELREEGYGPWPAAPASQAARVL